jgi:hypothetical protein
MQFEKPVTTAGRREEGFMASGAIMALRGKRLARRGKRRVRGVRDSANLANSRRNPISWTTSPESSSWRKFARSRAGSLAVGNLGNWPFRHHQLSQ